jgi:hypothetical protein
MYKILALGDGFACSHIWPMWPNIIESLTENTEVINLGKVGAGNEFIFNSTLDYIYNNDVDYVLVQWAISKRLDLLIDTEDKKKLVNSCPSYSTNTYVMNTDTWWLSSASKTIDNIIGLKQSKIRTRNYILALESILEKRSIPYSFFSTYRCDVYPDKNINWNKWIDVYGMEGYSRQERFLESRLNEIQPSTYVQKQYVLEYMNKLPFKWKTNDF